MPPKKPSPPGPFFDLSAAGFTILEIVAVLVILAILTTVAASRYWDTDAADTAAAGTLKSHLRYAQLRAMGDTQTWGIAINNSAYTLQKNGTTAPIRLPGETGATKNLENATISPASTVTFSSGRGIPIDGSGQPAANDQNIDVGSKTITITANTGFVP